MQSKTAIFFLILSAFFLFNSCGNLPNDQSTESASEKSNDVQKQEQVRNDLAELPSVSLDVLKKLWNECDYVDYVYYQLPISASVDSQNSIRSSLRHIAEDVAQYRFDCKAIGRVFFQIKGDNVLQGDIFFTNDCTYFLWVDNKGTYYASNSMTEEGLNFFTSNVKAAIQQINAAKATQNGQ